MGVYSHENTPEGRTETHKSSFSPYKQVNGRNGDHEWLRMTNAFILCGLVWKVQKGCAANREGSFKSYGFMQLSGNIDTILNNIRNNRFATLKITINFICLAQTILWSPFQMILQKLINFLTINTVLWTLILLWWFLGIRDVHTIRVLPLVICYYLISVFISIDPTEEP